MPDEIVPTAPPVVTPPVVPPAQPPLPGTGVPPVAAAPAAAPGEPKKRFIRIPQAEFSKRVKREAASLVAETVKAELGCSLEEAKAIVAARRAQAGAAPDSLPGQSAADKARISELEAKVVEEAAARAVAEKKARRATQRAADDAYEANLRHKALSAGVDDAHMDFALKLFGDAVNGTAEGQPVPEPGAFFASLKPNRGYLFRGAVPTEPVVVPVRPATAPPESGRPGGELPAQAAAGSAPPAVDASKMSDQEFAAYRPGRRTASSPGRSRRGAGSGRLGVPRPQVRA